MKTDMSPQAVTTRLRKTSDLRRLCIALGGDRLKKKLRNAATTRTGRIQQRSERTKSAQNGDDSGQATTPSKPLTPHESASRQETSLPCSEKP